LGDDRICANTVVAPITGAAILEHQGRQREIVERRKQLRDLHPSLTDAACSANRVRARLHRAHQIQ
jgi:hypothetical protein